MDFSCCHFRSAWFWACLYGVLLWSRISAFLKYSTDSAPRSSLQKSDLRNFSLVDFELMVGPYSLISRFSVLSHTEKISTPFGSLLSTPLLVPWFFF
jgi:hypothetical protein